MRIWLLLWVVLILAHTNAFIIGTAVVSGQCLDDQKSLLLELKSSLNFFPSMSTKLVKWNQGNDSWDGVTCEGGRVTGLDLSFEGIIGGLDDSSSLFRLNYLQRLNLAYNGFDSLEIPSGFGKLTNLVYLNLSNAGFVGQVPIGISRLTRLVTLDVSLLYFFGLTPLKLENPNLKMLVGNLSELRELYLDGANVSATGNELCNALSPSLLKLQVLSMMNCHLSGPIESCSSLVHLRSLSMIKLDNNNLSTTVPKFFSHFHNLTTLQLHNCGLQGEFPQEIFQVQTLQTLDLSYNKLLRGSLPGFSENGSVQTLVLSHTNMSGRLPDSIGNLRNLSRLELGSCNFHGNIPSSFSNLSQLAYLDFSFNNFTGQIISSLFTLPSIQKIDLSNNRFSGPVKGSFNATSHELEFLDLSANNMGGELPMSIWELRGLQHLSLSSNNFSGSFHINLVRQLKNLSYLGLSYNHFFINAANTASHASSFPDLTKLSLASCHLRTFPEFLAEQHSLEGLDLADNQIQGEIPKWIWELQNLWSLNLSSNLLDDIETPSPNLTSTLFVLDLSTNQIQGEIPKWIWELQNLVYLYLSSNLLDDIETPSPNLTSSLYVLDLHKNRLRGQTLPLPPSARYMDFSSNNFDLVIPPAIGTSLSSAIFFSLSNNSIQGLIPESICKAHYLEVLDLSHNNLSGNIPDCLAMESLKVLNLRNNALDGSIINFPETCGLQTLAISSNRLRGKFPKSMANCTTLELLDVGDNQIDDAFPCELKSIASLRVLVLRSNKFHGGVGCPEFNGNWTRLQIVDISSNNFKGPLPAQWLTSWDAMKANVDFNHIQYATLRLEGLYYQDTVTVTVRDLKVELVKILTLFTSIDFSCNNFEGPIPESLGALKALYFLNLSRNAFSGPIPSSLGRSQQLESLDLSWNDLNGTIPTQLSDLNFLSVLNLSYNKLVGSIPAVKQFLTFSASSFEGNAGLCGQQLETSCSIIPNGTKEASDDGDDDDSVQKWFYLGIPLGFAVGFWAFCGPLAFIKSWRLAYYRFWDKVLFRHSRP